MYLYLMDGIFPKYDT